MKERIKKVKKKRDKRFLILNIIIIAVIVFAFAYVWTVGDDYTLHTNFYPEDGTTKNVVVDVKDDDVVEFVNVRTEKGELVADFRSDNRGKTDVLISYSVGDTKMDPMVFNLEVNEFDTIIDHTMGSVRFNGDKVVIISIIVLLVLAEIMMLWMYIDYRKHGKFSYSMIACGGLSIFNAILLAYVIYYLINWPTLSIGDFLMLVTGAGTIMLIILFPLMLLLSILLAISNIWLMKHEGYRPVNALGIFFAVIWALGTLWTLGFYFIPYDSFSSGGDNYKIYNLILMVLVYVIGYLECMFISTVMCSFLATKYKVPMDRDFIVILGCAIRGDGTLTPLLKDRVDSAVAFEKKQYRTNGKHAVFVPSGGQGADEVISEGEAMENYLKSIGIPEDRIAREDKSTSTLENMKYSKEVIDGLSNSEDKKIAFATSSYHVFRGYIMAKKSEMEDAKGISAKTKPYFFPNAFLREFVGLLFDKKWSHIVFVLAIVAFFGTLAYLII